MPKIDSEFVKKLYSDYGQDLTPEKLEYINNTYASNDEFKNEFLYKYGSKEQEPVEGKKKTQEPKSKSTANTKTSGSRTPQVNGKPISGGKSQAKTSELASSSGATWGEQPETIFTSFEKIVKEEDKKKKAASTKPTTPKVDKKPMPTFKGGLDLSQKTDAQKSAESFTNKPVMKEVGKLIKDNKSVSNTDLNKDIEYEYVPEVDAKTGKEVWTHDEKGKLVRSMERVPIGYGTARDTELLRIETLKKKAEKKITVSEISKKYKEETKVTEEDINKINADIDSKLNNEGIGNKISNFFSWGADVLSNKIAPIIGQEITANPGKPYAKEEKQAIDQLMKENKVDDISQINPEAILNRTKEIVQGKKITALRNEKVKEFQSNLTPEQSEAINNEEVNNWKTLKDREKFLSIEATLEVDNFENIKRDLIVTKNIIDKKIRDGEGITQEFADYANKLSNQYNQSVEELTRIENDIIGNVEDIGSTEDEVDYLKRNYSNLDKFKETVKLGFGDMYMNLGLKQELFMGDLFENIDPDRRNELIDSIIEWENAKEKTRGEYSRNVEFEDLSLGNFGAFFMQEFGSQISILTQMMMPGGIGLIGVGSATDKYGQMATEENQETFIYEGKEISGYRKEDGTLVDSEGRTYKDDEVKIIPTLKRDLSKGNMFLTSTAFGLAESLLGAMPTKNIFSRSLRSIGTNQSARALFRQSIKASLKKKAARMVDAASTEAVSEGATQVVQNVADIMSGKKDVSIIDNVGHAAFSGGIISLFMTSAPEVGGLLLKKMSSNQSSKEVRKNIESILKLRDALNKKDLSNESVKAIQDQIKNLESTNEKIIKKNIKRVENLPAIIVDTIVQLNKKQELLRIQANEIKTDVNLDKELKLQLLEQLKSEFSTLEEQREKLVSDEATVLDALPESENKKLRRRAINQLLDENKNSNEAQFTNDVIDKKAIKIYNKENKTSKEVSTEENIYYYNTDPKRGKVESKPESVPEGYTRVKEVENSKELDSWKKQQPKEIESLREKEIAELKNEVENADDFITDGKIDAKKIAESDNAKAKEIYAKYDKLISPMLDTKVTDEKVNSYVQELDSTKKSDPETYWSVSEVSNEDAAKGTIIDTEDGSAMVKANGDIVGVFKKIGSKAKGVAQDLLNRAVAAGGTKLDNFDGYLTKQYEKAGFRVVSRTPFNEKYAPEGWNKDKHGTPDVVAMVYDPNNELNIEEKNFDNLDTGYDEMIAYRDSVLKNKDNKGRVLSKNKLDVEKQVSNIANKKLAKALVNAVASVSKILPNVEFIVHDTDESFRSVSGEGKNQSSNGLYENGKIHINASKANGRTVAHEVFHALLLDKVKTDFNAQNVTKKMIESIASKIDNNSKLKAKLEDFASMYDDNIQNEEKLAELVGMLAENYNSFSGRVKEIIKNWLNNLAKSFGVDLFESNDVFDALNTIAKKVSVGKEITNEDIILIEDREQGGESEVGTFNFSRSQADPIKAPSVKNDNRDFIKEFVEDVDLSDFKGKKFVTNMYDYTNAGLTDLGNGFTINMFGGKNYVPLMMSLNDKKLGDVSNLAAFNTKAQAETFIRNSINGGANLFAPHSGTKSQSWQFQQHTFAELVNLILDNDILSEKELIGVFNSAISSDKGKKSFNAFKGKLGKNIKNFNSFSSNPKKIVELLDINNNFSPDLRKALNNAIPGNKKFKEALGINNKEEFFDKITDPLNNGVVGGEIMGVVEFDPNTFEIVKTKEGDVGHHPSFAFSLLAKINGIYQPTKFYKSYDVTEEYTKYNKDKTETSKKSEQEKFAQKNVLSSAGAIPKIAKFEETNIRSQKSKNDNKSKVDAQKSKIADMKTQLSDLYKQASDVMNSINKANAITKKEELNKLKDKLNSKINDLKEKLNTQIKEEKSKSKNKQIEVNELKKQITDLFSASKEALKQTKDRVNEINKLKKGAESLVKSAINGLSAGDIGNRQIKAIISKINDITDVNFDEKLNEINDTLTNLYSKKDVNQAKANRKKAIKNVLSGKVGKLAKDGDRKEVLESKILNFALLDPSVLKKVLDDASSDRDWETTYF